MLRWWRRRVARRAALVAGVSTLGAGVVLGYCLEAATLVHLPWGLALACLLAASVTSGLSTALIVDLVVSSRLRRLGAFLQQAETGDFLARLPMLGEDEVGEAGDGINRVLARLTTLRVSVIDQGRELAATQEELRLQEALAAKSAELETRLQERRMLFEILRTSSSTTELDEVLGAITERVHQYLRMREVALLMLEGDDKLVVRSAQGFADPKGVLGMTIARGQGIAGEVASAGHAIVVRNVAIEPDYLAFWGHAPREGSFAAFPINYRGRMVGILGVTRPTSDPFQEPEVKLLDALADQAALSIRNAQLFAELRELSTHDELTKLANRRLLATRLANELDRARRFHLPVCVLMIDIDYFKQLNDRCGHPVGDAALERVASLLEGAVRRVDTVARIGGEEFVVVLPSTDAPEAVNVGEKLRSAIASCQDMPGIEAQPGHRLTISVGVAQFDERIDSDGDGLLARADEALYSAKRRGRDRLVVWEAAPAATAEAG